MYSYKLKIIIAGPTGVGKTVILNKFIGSNSSLNTPVDIRSKNFKIETLDIALFLSLWDICGNERFSIIRRILYKGAAGVVLVYDLTNKESYLEMDRWISELRTFLGSKIPIVLVGNKLDLIKDDKNDIINIKAKIKAEEYGAVYVETSAITGRNINLVFEELTKLIIKESIEQNSQKLRDKGDNFYENKNYKMAIETYNKMLFVNRDNFDRWYQLASSYFNINNLDKAIEHYNKEINLNNNNLARINLGEIYILKEEFNKALNIINEAQNLEQNNPKIFILLGRIFEKQNLYDKAIRHYEKAILLDPNNVKFRNDLGKLIKIKKKDEEKKKKIFEQKKKIEIKILFLNAEEKMNNGNYLKAIEHSKDIIDKLSKSNLEISRKNKRFLRKCKAYEDISSEIKKLSIIFEEITFQKLLTQIGYRVNFKDLEKFIEDLIKNNQIIAKLKFESIIFMNDIPKIASEIETCIVCKGDISGLNFKCFNCGVKYHYKCIKILKEKNFKCFYCENELPNIVDEMELKEKFDIDIDSPVVVSIENISFKLNSILTTGEIEKKDFTSDFIQLKENLIDELKHKVSNSFYNQLKNEINRFFDKLLDLSADKMNDIFKQQKRIFQTILRSLKKQEILSKLQMFIEKPDDLKNYIEKIIKSGWDEEKKDEWAEIMKEILDDWKAVEPKLWQKIGKAIIGFIGVFIGNQLEYLLSTGITSLYNWIKNNI